jgi:hypothetical protein
MRRTLSAIGAYKLSDADVKELGQLVTLVKSGDVKLYLTEQPGMSSTGTAMKRSQSR